MDSKNRTYLECERQWVFALLIFVGGFYGSYTYLLRGGVFCNAQTANFVLFLSLIHISEPTRRS